ncbi:MAG: hypothetical protein IKV43_04195 [Clostridia bacterium]|nr:hypothetical protein [Clostridia bacterium]
MKRILGLILVLALAVSCVFAFASCKKDTATTKSVYDLVASANPTKTVTLTDYVKGGVTYEGEFIMSVEGNNSIFEFSYERPRTVAEGAEEGTTNPIKTVDGVIYFKDGKFSEDGDKWTAEAPSTTLFSFDLKAEYLTGASITDDGKTLTAEMTPENAIKVLGTDLKPQGNVKITVKTNGVSLSKVVLQYVTADGASVTIDTSYTYNNVVLTFPEA